MAKQVIKQWAAEAEGELRTTSVTANQVLVTVNMTNVAGMSFNGVIFAVRGRVLSFQEDGSTDYVGFQEIIARGSRRAGVLVLSNAIDPNSDGSNILGGAIAPAGLNFNVSSDTIQFRITPVSAGNIRHFGRLFIDAYQYT